MADASYDNMTRTTHRMIDSYNQWDIDAMIANRTADCVTEILPKSMGREPMNNTEYRMYFASVMSMFQGFTVIIESELYDVQTKRAALHLRSVAQTPVGRYSNEYAFFLTFDHDCNKISRFEEMVDSKYTVGHLIGLRSHLRKHRGNMEVAWANTLCRARL
ncbi:hypothetical protein LTR78_010281 [Recurvomyces mirabilis]|uniref:SnoaL-like domain-containing protein n=1 Tax=Recurvomyces mirabilis TaxID=574656 RepID=A0AAE0TMG2_9PEZI|nr:hypothetical protein LTR78_010281 [Recurvomyces mirabilis]KAK5149649.1 hypothetical protein LTS14_010780 [Recurvomyces mirabilis]